VYPDLFRGVPFSFVAVPESTWDVAFFLSRNQSLLTFSFQSSGFGFWIFLCFFLISFPSLFRVGLRRYFALIHIVVSL